MEKYLVNGYEFIKIDLGDAVMVFSTAKNGLDFNKNTEEGQNNIKNIKEWFKVKKVEFLNQIHSDYVVKDSEEEDGDALITDKTNNAIGVFTADCVPILLYDKKNKAIAAVHSGWRGTFSCVLSRTIEKMEKVYSTKANDLVAYIGPHMHQCCYEVSKDIIEQFENSQVYKGVDLAKGRMLSMTNCIFYQLVTKGVKKENINDLNICTFCSGEYELHSYRKSENKYGRMFSFIYTK